MVTANSCSTALARRGRPVQYHDQSAERGSTPNFTRNCARTMEAAPGGKTALYGSASDQSYDQRQRLGRWFKRNEGRVVDGLMLKQAGSRDGYLLWSLIPS